MSIQDIRESERHSHIEAYTNNVLYRDDGWLKKPVKTVMDLLPHFRDYPEMRILDLGCGIGRNSIAIAKYFSSISARIDCIDILDLAIEKLKHYAQQYEVTSAIHGIISPIEAFPISADTYDLTVAISALEHVKSQNLLIKKLTEIHNGTKENGIVCLVMNSSVREFDLNNGVPRPAQFEVNLPTDDLLNILHHTFKNWEIIKQSRQEQHYVIPRMDGPSSLYTNVITYVAKKTGRK